MATYSQPPSPFSLLLPTLKPPTGFRSTDLWELYDGLHRPLCRTVQTTLQLAYSNFGNNEVWSPPTPPHQILLNLFVCIILLNMCTSDKQLQCWLMNYLPSTAESAGQPGGSSSSHGIHRQFSSVWKHLVEPAGSHRTAGHQRTRTGECFKSQCSPHIDFPWKGCPVIFCGPFLHFWNFFFPFEWMTASSID